MPDLTLDTSTLEGLAARIAAARNGSGKILIGCDLAAALLNVALVTTKPKTK